MNHYLIYYNTLFSYNRLCLCCLNNKIIAGFDSGKLAGMIVRFSETFRNHKSSNAFETIIRLQILK